ncbi:hypothetical protein JCM10295v2_006097 [Rhodotorula toruloides]
MLQCAFGNAKSFKHDSKTRAIEPRMPKTQATLQGEGGQLELRLAKADPDEHIGIAVPLAQRAGNAAEVTEPALHEK